MPVVSSSDYAKSRSSNVVISESGNAEPIEPWDLEEKPEEVVLDDDVIAQMKSELVTVSPSRFVEFAVRIPDKKAQSRVNFSFNNRQYLILPYDTPAKRTLLKCGRQVEKSTLLGNKALAYCCIINSFNVLYVSPTNLQTMTFSRDRLKEPIDTSEIIKAWTTTKLNDNVFLKKFVNRSQITLRYAFHNADRVRGIPADYIVIDELQDIITDNIPVIEECASHSDFKMYTFSGTPKSYDNAIEHYWENLSTQNEWVVPCHRHGPVGGGSSIYWNVLGEENIGESGLICAKCKMPINSMDEMSQWASMQESIKKKLAEPYESYRIPQLMVPWVPWTEILDKYRKLPRNIFFNEVLGLSYDSGQRPLTRQDMMDNCDERMLMTPDYLSNLHSKITGGSSMIYAGIDWGGGGSDSHTVLSLATYLDGKFTVFYVHRFDGPESDPEVAIEIIEQMLRNWKVTAVGVDWGGGFYQNNRLLRKFGSDRIFVYQYSTPGSKVKWDPGLKRFLVHRTEVMSDMFSAIKRRNVFKFPSWEAFEDPFGKDFLNIFSEYNEQQRQIQYKKTPDVSDDSFHSVLLCLLASMIRHPRPDILNPMAKTGYSTVESY